MTDNPDDSGIGLDDPKFIADDGLDPNFVTNLRSSLTQMYGVR